MAKWRWSRPRRNTGFWQWEWHLPSRLHEGPPLSTVSAGSAARFGFNVSAATYSTCSRLLCIQISAKEEEEEEPIGEEEPVTEQPEEEMVAPPTDDEMS